MTISNPTTLPTLRAHMESEQGGTAFTVREEQEPNLLAMQAETLPTALEFASRPHCTYEAIHPDMGAAYGFGDGIVTETCREPIAHRILLFEEECAHYDRYAGEREERCGLLLHLYCEGHAARLRDDIASGDYGGKPEIREDQPIS